MICSQAEAVQKKAQRLSMTMDVWSHFLDKEPFLDKNLSEPPKTNYIYSVKLTWWMLDKWFHHTHPQEACFCSKWRWRRCGAGGAGVCASSSACCWRGFVASVRRGWIQIEICDDDVQFKSWTWLQTCRAGPAAVPWLSIWHCCVEVVIMDLVLLVSMTFEWFSVSEYKQEIKLPTWSLSRCNYWHWGSKLTAIKRERDDRQ